MLVPKSSEDHVISKKKKNFFFYIRGTENDRNLLKKEKKIIIMGFTVGYGPLNYSIFFLLFFLKTTRSDEYNGFFVFKIGQKMNFGHFLA